MSRLVTWECPDCAFANAALVENDATGSPSLPCSRCAALSPVDVSRSEAPIRPRTTPAQREAWALERSRAAREHLATLVAEIVAYLRVRDLEVVDLPHRSPLRIALVAAQAELAKSAP